MRRGDRTAVIPARAGHRPLIKHITVATSSYGRLKHNTDNFGLLIRST